jgi:DNA-binding NtrC family response regulator
MSTDLYPEFPIVVVDDEAPIVQAVLSILKAEGITNAFGLQDSMAAMGFIETRDVGIVLVDLIMPGLTGQELLVELRHNRPEISVAVVTGNREIEQAVACMRLGAADYLTKPVEGSRLVATVRRLIENQELRRENLRIKDRMLAISAARHPAFAKIITADPAMESLMKYSEAIAPTSHPVLITGETGTGKELFARAIHELSGRSGDFIAVNVAGLDDAFFSDALFGHRAGAFTGAEKALEGLIEKAKEGTLFLDEIGDLALASQVKLLRVIETGEFYPVGSDSMKRSKARIVVATNVDLSREAGEGVFRKDLFYRLKSHHIQIPPLRDRLGDVPLLFDHFLASAAASLGSPVPESPSRLMSLLSTYEYPGNVRELEAMVFDGFSRGMGRLQLKFFKAAIGGRGNLAAQELSSLNFPSRLPTIKKTIELLIAEAIKRASGNQALAARLLGISPQAMSKRLKNRKVLQEDKAKREINIGG